MQKDFKYRFSPLFNPENKEPYRLSRSKIELYLECVRCFYLDRRMGIFRPSGPSLTLNNTVDELLKKEFDLLRVKGEKHALMEKYKIDAVPYTNPEMNRWRENFKGKEYHERENNIIVTGAIDDIWQAPNGELSIVEYYPTSSDFKVDLNDESKKQNKKQMEIYQWIFRNAGYKISRTGYFVMVNASKVRPEFDGKLEFELTILPYLGDTSWILDTIAKIKTTLLSDTLPDFTFGCDYCKFTKDQIKKPKKLETLQEQHGLGL